MKRITLSFVFFLSVISSFAYDIEIDGIYYNLVRETRSAEVTHDGKTNSWGALIGHSYSGSVTIPPSITFGGEVIPVTAIGTNAFVYCSSLISINISNSVKNIGSNAFSGCTSLTSVNTGDGVTIIGENAFACCTSLISVNIGNSVLRIETDAFAGCTSLVSVNLGNSVKGIGDGAFSNCTSLVTIDIPGSVEFIDSHVFYRCTSLVSLIIPNSVNKIGMQTFYDCKSLVSVTIGNSVKSIGSLCFWECTSLKEIFSLNITPPDISYDSFKGVDLLGTKLYVPTESLEKYKANNNYWKMFWFILPLQEPMSIETANMNHNKPQALYDITGKEIVHPRIGQILIKKQADKIMKYKF